MFSSAIDDSPSTLLLSFRNSLSDEGLFEVPGANCSTCAGKELVHFFLSILQIAFLPFCLFHFELEKRLQSNLFVSIDAFCLFTRTSYNFYEIFATSLTGYRQTVIAPVHSVKVKFLYSTERLNSYI